MAMLRLTCVQYNFFVLGLPPANFNTTYYQYLSTQNDTNTSFSSNDVSPSLTNWNSISDAYPAGTMSYQDNLNVDTSGIITSYYLDQVSTAVLSIPSFYAYGDGISTFSQAIIDFINNATANSATSVIIDLQQNSGGQESLAFEVFRRVCGRRLGLESGTDSFI